MNANSGMTRQQIRKMVVLGMLCAIAFALVAFIRIPITSFEFLKYEPKDIAIVLGGFFYGPGAAAIISVVVSLLEMVTISSTGFVGFIMNVLGSCAFACTASYIYKKKRNITGAVIGLTAGVAAFTAVMLLWNYMIAPLFMGIEREAIVKMLLPVFLPFNLIKGGLNVTAVVLLYRPLVLSLQKSGLIPTISEEEQKGRTGWVFLALLVLATLILLILVLTGSV